MMNNNNTIQTDQIDIQKKTPSTSRDVEGVLTSNNGTINQDSIISGEKKRGLYSIDDILYGLFSYQGKDFFLLEQNNGTYIPYIKEGNERKAFCGISNDDSHYGQIIFFDDKDLDVDPSVFPDILEKTKRETENIQDINGIIGMAPSLGTKLEDRKARCKQHRGIWQSEIQSKQNESESKNADNKAKEKKIADLADLLEKAGKGGKERVVVNDNDKEKKEQEKGPEKKEKQIDQKHTQESQTRRKRLMKRAEESDGPAAKGVGALASAMAVFIGGRGHLIDALGYVIGSGVDVVKWLANGVVKGGRGIGSVVGSLRKKTVSSYKNRNILQKKKISDHKKDWTLWFKKRDPEKKYVKKPGIFSSLGKKFTRKKTTKKLEEEKTGENDVTNQQDKKTPEQETKKKSSRIKKWGSKVKRSVQGWFKKKPQ